MLVKLAILVILELRCRRVGRCGASSMLCSPFYTTGTDTGTLQLYNMYARHALAVLVNVKIPGISGIYFDQLKLFI